MILLILALLMATVTIFIVFMGFHKRVIIEKKKLPRRFALYHEFVGNYPQVMSQIYTEFFRDIYGVFHRDTLSFGIYYDNLSRTVDPNQARGIVGVYVFEQDVGAAQAFASSHAGYHFAVFPEVDALFSRIIHRNALSFLWARWRIFPAFFKYLSQYHLVTNIDEEVNGIIEDYYWGSSNKYTEFILPFGPHAQAYYRTSAPAPRQKIKSLRKFAIRI